MTLMDLWTLDTKVPAITARGAIVEKGRGRRKVIGDYLNNPQCLPAQTNVGASLLAMRAPHSTFCVERHSAIASRLAPTGTTTGSGFFGGRSKLDTTLALGLEQAHAGRSEEHTSELQSLMRI